MRKRIFWIVVWLMAALLLWVYLDNLYELLTKSYYVDESRLCLVDIFHLQSRAYDQSTATSNGNSHESELVFQSTNGYSFAIDREIYNAIRNKEKLKDTLMYHNIKFTVFTDTATCRKYKESKTPIFLRVYQIEIGNEKYIDVPRINDYATWDRKELIVLTMFLCRFLLY